MKISIPTLAAGKAILCPVALPPAQRGRAVIDPTPEQIAQIQSGENWWTPTGEGAGTLSAPPARVPTEIPAWKGRTILRLTPAGDGTLWDAVQAAIAGLPDQQRIAAEEVLGGTVRSRSSPTLAALAAALNLASEQVDALFAAANNIQG